MESIVVSSSRSAHANTRRVAEVVASALRAPVRSPEDATDAALLAAECVGFGSGIYQMGFDPDLLARARRLPDMTGRRAFVFATSGMPELPLWRPTKRLVRLLEARGFEVVGTFTCRGLDTWGPWGLLGGVSRGHPDAVDLERAAQFARTLEK